MAETALSVNVLLAARHDRRKVIAVRQDRLDAVVRDDHAAREGEGLEHHLA